MYGKGIIEDISCELLRAYSPLLFEQHDVMRGQCALHLCMCV